MKKKSPKGLPKKGKPVENVSYKPISGKPMKDRGKKCC